jgi:hypothetical protein
MWKNTAAACSRRFSCVLFQGKSKRIYVGIPAFLSYPSRRKKIGAEITYAPASEINICFSPHRTSDKNPSAAFSFLFYSISIPCWPNKIRFLRQYCSHDMIRKEHTHAYMEVLTRWRITAYAGFLFSFHWLESISLFFFFARFTLFLCLSSSTYVHHIKCDSRKFRRVYISKSLYFDSLYFIFL